jgi:hypothetical protein
MRQRLTAWSDLWFQILLLIAFWLAVAYPLQWFVNAIMTYNFVIGLVLLCLVFPLLLLLFAARINTKTVNWLMGTETFDYQNATIEEYIQSRSGADRVFQKSVRTLKLHGWCPAFRYSGKLRLPVREQSVFTTIGSNHLISPIEQQIILILHDSADRFFARYIAACLSDLNDRIHIRALAANSSADFPMDQHPGYVIFILSSYSAAHAEKLMQQKELWLQNDLLIISLEKTHTVLPDLRQLQWIDATTWNFSQVLAAVRKTIRAEPIEFIGAKDARSNALGAPSRYLFWLILLLALPLLGVYDSFRLYGFTLMSAWLFYLVAAVILWRAMDRWYSLRLSGWILLLAISFLWVQYSINGMWHERGNVVLPTIGLLYACWLFLRSDRFRTKQITHVSNQRGGTVNEYSFLSILYWGPDKSFEWRIFIPVLLAWAVLLGITVYLGG